LAQPFSKPEFCKIAAKESFYDHKKHYQKSVLFCSSRCLPGRCADRTTHIAAIAAAIESDDPESSKRDTQQYEPDWGTNADEAVTDAFQIGAGDITSAGLYSSCWTLMRFTNLTVADAS
jgi:hypothetical protein